MGINSLGNWRPATLDSPRMKHPIRTTGAVAVALLQAIGSAGCKGNVAAYADAPRLGTAQKAWCAVVAKHEATEGEPFAHLAACERATPTASAEFLARVTDCYGRARDGESTDNQTDLGLLVAQCTDEALINADPGEVSASEVVVARCSRMKRCESVEVDACLTGFGSLDGTQRAALTAMYNLRAQHEIAECLESTDCQRDEDQARTGCYKRARDTRVWLPFSP